MHSVGTVKTSADGSIGSNVTKRLSSSLSLNLPIKAAGVLEPSETNSVLDPMSF